MKRRQNKTGVTLVEILVVVAIIAILVTMVIGIAARIDTQGKERLTENTIALLTAALGEFGDYGYSYSDSNYADFKFPLDCNNFPQNDLEGALKDALGTTTTPAITPVGAHEPNYSGSEALYFFLSRVPESRQTLDRIDKKLVTNLGLNGSPMEITVGSGVDAKVYPLFRVIDPWGGTLRYSYYRNIRESSPSSEPESSSPRTFPVITSAGPDKEFDSADDITSRD
jgi:prepilin-type N-terminal cleavage/methylation domain-containing protein